MISSNRRQLLTSSGLIAVAAMVPQRAHAARGGAVPNLFIGTGGHGHTFPGATVPFGMVQLSPDTNTVGWDAVSGYHREDGSILGFSHTHLSGTGVGDMLDVLVVPAVGEVKLSPGTPDARVGSYRQRYASVHAEPGYYRVSLESGIRAELTCTDRTGWHRYIFPKGAGHILLDLAHMIGDPRENASLIDEASLSIDGDGTLTGSRRVHRWAKGRRIHFALQFSRKPDRIELFGDRDTPSAGSTKVIGRQLKAVAHFEDAGVSPILVRCAISAVDVAGARGNLAAEASDWNFDRIRHEALQRWAQTLDVVRVAGGTADQRAILSTAVYHAHIGPTLFSDQDGRYIGLDRQIHRAEPGSPAYSSYSTWDTYRALHPLLTLVAPDQAARFARDLVRHTSQSPYGPPTWPLQGIETGMMMGWHSVSIMAEARNKGLPADYAAAWPNVRRRSFDRTMPDVEATRGRGLYMDLGYIPADKINESVSRTQEYAYDDYASAVLAASAGADVEAAALQRRSLNYRNVLDRRIGFARPRFADGSWWLSYDPVEFGHDTSTYRDYTEANGWQATFLNQHDIYGQMDWFGGAKAFEAKLDALFSAPSMLPDNAAPDIAGLVGQYAHGNEPGHHVPYLYAYCGAPHKTQRLVRRLLLEMYRNEPDGMIGNDDCGQMSAWFIFSALGFYPVDPVSGIYVFGSPLFDTIDLKVGDRRLRIVAHHNAPDRPYVQSVRWNGQPWSKGWIAHAELVKGGALEFVMGDRPSNFAADPAARPPSFSRTAQTAAE